jgi:hypothetical protein
MRMMRMGELLVLLASEVSVSHLPLSRALAFSLLMLLLLLPLSMSGPSLMMVSTPKLELLVEGTHVVMSMAMATG